MNALPTLRRKILRSFSLMILLYAGLGVFLMISVLIASGTTPKLLHVNYDSIVAATQMKEAWNALDRPERFSQRSSSEWKNRFEQALSFEQDNITEKGESEVASALRKEWDSSKKAQFPVSTDSFKRMNDLLDRLTAVNEQGMFGLAHENTRLSQGVLIGGVIYLLLSLLLALFLADSLAERLSRPLKSIAEALHRRPGTGRRLKLAEPNSLELLILNQELLSLWDRIAESERVNVQEIVQQKTKLETVLESVEDALLVLDASGKVSHSNACLLEMIGLDAAQVQGSAWLDLPTMNENYLKLRESCSDDMPEAQEIELKLKNAVRQFSARSRKINAPSGELIASLYLFHDITEKRQRDRFRAEFIDLLSHELKTPLQSLGTASELLASQKNELPESARPLVETISEDLERIRAVANEFVQVTQSYSKILKLKLEHAVLSPLLQEWIKPFRVLAKDRDVKITFSQEGSSIIQGRLDLVKFPWVISNLLANAIRFSPQGGTVEVVLTDRNSAVEIQIRDQGPGITEEDQRHMFEPFFQGPKQGSSGKSGLFGIGLTIAKEVVEAHDGRIEYYRRQPQGSEFRIVLPFPPQDFA
jgi:PAS domain S-box-containing protein